MVEIAYSGFAVRVRGERHSNGNYNHGPMKSAPRPPDRIQGGEYRRILVAGLQVEETQGRGDLDILSEDEAVCLLFMKGNRLSAKAQSHPCPDHGDH